MTAPNTTPGRRPLLSGERGSRGFTLIELMIVVSIIGILAAIAVPNYQWGIIRAKEAVLRENLYNMRNTLDQFTADQGKAPESLQELVDKRYLRGIPTDPFTKSSETWVYVPPEPPSDPTVTSIGSPPDVKSGSDLVGSDGRPYSEW